MHALFRKYISTYTETILGYRNPLIERATSDPVLMSNSNPYAAVSHIESIMASIYGWKRLGKQRPTLRLELSVRSVDAAVGRMHICLLLCLYKTYHIYIYKGISSCYINRQPLDPCCLHMQVGMAEPGHGGERGDDSHQH